MNGFEVSKKFYKLFFGERGFSLTDYLNNSYCDELIEVDLNNDTVNFIYHVNNKYSSAVTDKKYTSVYNYVLHHFVHPDDVETYAGLMNPQTILERLANAEIKNFDFVHFRYRLQDGTWRWVEQAALTGQENGLAEGIVRFYVFDIQNVKSRELGEENDESSFLYNKRDEITGLLSQKSFFKNCDDLYVASPNKNWCLISTDIEHFKLFDEWYGRDKGNTLLNKIGLILTDFDNDTKGVSGYLGQDDFVSFAPYNKDLIVELFDSIRSAVVEFGLSVGFMPAFGVCLLKDAINIPDSYDKASIAMYRAKNDIKKKIYLYDPQMHQEAEREYRTLIEFMDALKNGEITFYLQPQCRISTKKVVGAEALARWVKPDGTIIPPNDFIPVLEKYGFVTDLDQYIWDKACSTIRDWVNQGHTPIPISVNVSRVDIYTIDITNFFAKLIKKYKISPSLIKIEITESAYVEKASFVRELVDELRNMGFLVLMDDFGSGYSSLNMLNNLKVDAIKLDGNFLRFNDSDFEKGVHILESIVNMTKTIALPIIVEGVETKSQCEFIENLGCRYVQGFYFYKPMPIEKFEKLISNESNIDTRGLIMKSNEQVRVREFLDQNIYSDSMLNNIIGAVAFYEFDGEKVNIVRYNNQFYESVGTPGFHGRLENISQYMPREDRQKIINVLNAAIENKLNGSSEILRFYKEDGTLTSFLMRFYYLGIKEGSHRFYGSATNITDITDLRDKMNLLISHSTSTIIFMSYKNGARHYEVVCHGLAEATGLSREEFENRINDQTLYQNLSEKDKKEFYRIAKEYYANLKPCSYTYNFVRDDGKTVKLHMKSDPIKDKINNVSYLIAIRLYND